MPVSGKTSQNFGPVEPASFELRSVARTDVGLHREVNEDAFYVDDQLGLFLVCDGMGGHASGKIASELAVRTMVASIKSGEQDLKEGEDPLAASIRAANGSVYQRSQVDEACRGMGTTVVAVRAEDDMLHVCHCGDSRLYSLRDQQLSQLTRDHSLANLYADKPHLRGSLGPAESNVIVRAVGLEEDVEVDHRVVAMEHGDVFLLCCDGITDLIEDWMIREIMVSGETLDEVADNLVRAANANGGTDNITVVLIAIFAAFEPTGPGEQTETVPGF